ncbi:MAG: hypothetical protein IKK75_11395 [Clostridia bacterium]|nr:hypothetical protein [Clostridia bacterium]
MIRRMALVWLALCMLMSAACAQTEYPDGIYRGFYYDGGIEQIAIQFEMQDGIFTSLVYRGVKYKDGDYMIEDASDAQKATLAQYEQMADYLIGKGVEAIDDLYAPYDFVQDVDAVTTATVQSSKLISALWDGLNRRPFKLLNTSKLPQAEPYQDGVYRGSYMEGGSEEVAIEFILRDNVFESLSYRALQYRGVDYLSEDADEATRLIAGQFGQLLSYLEGRDVTAVNDLYQPADMVEDADTFAGATVRAPKVISAIWDALNRHAFRIE